MDIAQIDLDNRREVKAFLALPFRLYRQVPQWVPPMASDAGRMLSRTHPFYGHSEAAFFLARRDGLVVGRLAVLNNRNYNAFNAERTAFFYLFECENDRQASDGLFAAAFAWARQRGLDRMRGPKGFTALDGLGMLVRGFEHRPAMGIPYNLPHYPELVEAAGFVGEGDIVSGYLHRDVRFPERVHQLSALVQHRRGLSIARFTRRRDLHTLVDRLGDLYNNALGGTAGNVPLTDDEIRTIARQLLAFADPRLVKIVMKDDEPVGFLFAYPDISAAIQRSGGRLLPFGWIDWLLELRRTRWINVNGAGIVEKYRGLGGTAILFSEMYQSVREGRYEHADIVQIGVENEKMQREMRDLGIEFYKLHRMYQRSL